MIKCNLRPAKLNLRTVQNFVHSTYGFESQFVAKQNTIYVLRFGAWSSLPILLATDPKYINTIKQLHQLIVKGEHIWQFNQWPMYWSRNPKINQLENHLLTYGEYLKPDDYNFYRYWLAQNFINEET